MNYKMHVHVRRLEIKRIFTILNAQNHGRELVRLEQWAIHKGLEGPQRAYRAQHNDVERALLRYAMTDPLAYRLATWLRWLNRLISPTPRFLPKGSATAYRRLKRESRHNQGNPIVQLFERQT